MFTAEQRLYFPEAIHSRSTFHKTCGRKTAGSTLRSAGEIATSALRFTR